MRAAQISKVDGIGIDQDDSDCGPCKNTGYEKCPHNEIDADAWCTICDYPADEPADTIMCRNCQV